MDRMLLADASRRCFKGVGEVPKSAGNPLRDLFQTVQVYEGAPLVLFDKRVSDGRCTRGRSPPAPEERESRGRTLSPRVKERERCLAWSTGLGVLGV